MTDEWLPYRIRGEIELMTRPRSRRTSGGASGTVDLTVSVSADDGYIFRDETGYNTNQDVTIVGQFSAKVRDAWHRWDNVTIDQGATIDVAYVSVYERYTASPSVLSDLYFNDSDDAVAPTSAADYNAKAKTTAFTAWDNPSLSTTGYVNSPSLVDEIKEVIDRASWVSGNALMLLWIDGGTTDGNLIRPWSADDTTPLKLHVEWST